MFNKGVYSPCGPVCCPRCLGSGLETADTSHTSSAAASSQSDYQSVTTPGLVSAVCRLLGNLVGLAPEDSLQCLGQENMYQTLLG